MWRRGFKKINPKNEYEPIIVGIVGSAHGSGATHLSISMGIFFSEYYKRRTAVLEWNGSNEFENIRKNLSLESTSKNRFSYLSVDFFGDAGIGDFVEISEMNFECIVIDFGEDVQGYRRELNRCSRIFMVSALDEWKLGRLLQFLNIESDAILSKINFLYIFGRDAYAKKIRRAYNISITKIPFSEDAFSLKSESIAFFRDVLRLG